MSDENGNSTYAYRGVPPTPTIAAALIRELFGGRLAEYKTIAEEILRVHLARGGAQPQQTNFNESVVKTALSRMKKTGQAENPSLGYWRILASDLSTQVEPTPSEPLGLVIDNGAELTEISSENEISEVVPDLIIGSGRGAVYLYYLPTYRVRAEEQHETAWPCKIGRTDRDPLQRVLAQAGTALPERPRIALVLKTSFPIALEAALHGVLILRGVKIDDAPGSEWFLTSPDEVLALVRFFDPELYSDNVVATPSAENDIGM